MMIGKLSASKDVTVVGAGISGLLVSYYLDRAGYRVRLFEAGDRPGGMIATQAGAYGLSESAAHSFPSTETLRELCADLGVELSVLKPEGRKRWILRGGRLRRFPLTVLESLRALARACFVRATKADFETLTLERWARRFLGTAALDYLLTPFVRGIYGADPAEINVSATFPALCVPEGHTLLSWFFSRKWRRSLSRRGEVVTPREGMQALTDALDRRLSHRLGDRYRKRVKVSRLSELTVEESNLILCVPASEAARLVGETTEVGAMLAKVRYSALTTATVIVDRAALSSVPEGLGVLIPKIEKRRALGVLFNSSSFEGRTTSADRISLTVMLPGTASSDVSSVVEAELRELFGLRGAPLEMTVRSWERAIPKYDEHLLRAWAVADRTWCATPGRILFGNYTGQVSIRGMAELACALSRTVSAR